MRILLVCQWAHSNCYYTAKFANALSRQPDLEVHLLIPDNFLTELLHAAIRVHHLHFKASTKLKRRSLLRSIPLLFTTFLVCRAVKPQWIHNLWLHHIPLLIGRCFTGAHLAYTAHDPILHTGESGFIRTQVNNYLIKKSDLCFIHGDSGRIPFKWSLKDKKAVLSIPHGEFGFWEKSGTVKQQPVILFFGRIRPYKGLSILLSAFEQLAIDFPGLKLRVCGEGDMQEYVPQINRISGVEIVNRFIEHHEIPVLFGQSLFVVLPYLEATQSGVIPMAFALGRTCIATDTGALTDIAQHRHNSLIVPPGDVAALNNAMRYLLNNQKERHRMEENALQSVHTAEALSWDKAAATVAEAYRFFDIKPFE
jgi:glycosyltransferase involved in cell wall biosynthesis